MSIRIGSRPVGDEYATFVIAEIGLAHEGSLGIAQSLVELASRVGVDAVKFQTHIAEEEGTGREQFRIKVFPQDVRRGDYWKRTGFTLEEWLKLAEFTRKLGLVFLSSPFSDKAVEWLTECNVPAWKLASGEIGNLPLFEKIAATKKPVLISSGMSTWSELDEAVAYFRQQGTEVAVLQCTSNYPCLPTRWGLNLINEMRVRYACPIGFSDHSGTITSGLAAVAYGASIVEFHLTFHKEMFGPDAPASLAPESAAELVRGIRALDTAKQNPVDKDRLANESVELRKLFTKSVVAAANLPSGTVLGRRHLAFKKPGDGFPAGLYKSLLNRRTVVELKADDQILESHLAPLT